MSWFRKKICPFKVGDIVNYKDSDGYDCMEVIAYKRFPTGKSYIIKLKTSNGRTDYESSDALEYVK